MDFPMEINHPASWRIPPGRGAAKRRIGLQGAPFGQRWCMHFDTHRRVHLHIIPTEMWCPGPGIFSPKKVLFGSRFRDFCPTFCHLSPKNPLWKGFQHTKQIPKPGTKLVGRYRTFIFSTSGVSETNMFMSNLRYNKLTRQ